LKTTFCIKKFARLFQNYSALFLANFVQIDGLRYSITKHIGLQFLPRDAMHKPGLCRHAVSVYLCVCPCVCLSRSWIMSKQINISSKFFHLRVATPF